MVKNEVVSAARVGAATGAPVTGRGTVSIRCSCGCGYTYKMRCG